MTGLGLAFVLLIVAVIAAATWTAWKVWRNVDDQRRSTRLDHLATAMFGVWFLLTIAIVIVVPRTAPGLSWLATTNMLIPCAAIVLIGVGVVAAESEERRARAQRIAMGLAVPPKRLLPRTLKTIYTLLGLPILTLALLAVVFVYYKAAGPPVDPQTSATYSFVVVGLVGGIYLAGAMCHVLLHKRRLVREAREAHERNLQQTQGDEHRPTGADPTQ
jgi:hypothetical protein